MRRRAASKQAVTPSLFPFLAVLVCTMGALIVLLVMVVQQARVQAADTETQEAAAAAQALAVADREALREAAESFQWRRDVLQQQRGEKTQELSHARGELSHLEQHLRELQARWQSLADRRQSLSQTASTLDEAAVHQQLAELQAQIEQAKADFAASLARSAERQRSYAIVPYEGPHGTKRRPLYLECTAEGIVVQPERLLLPVSDFQGPVGPGNPLDAVLRAKREHYARLSGKAVDPYPLILVRPSGVMAYAAARLAIKAWDDEFGYELLDESMPLAYAEPDPQLTERLQVVIDEARQRQRALIAAMPSRYSGVGGMLATRGAGFVPTGSFGETSFYGDETEFASVPGKPAPNRLRNRKPAGTSTASSPSGSRKPTAAQQDQPDVGGKPINAKGGAAGGQHHSGALRPLAASRGRNFALPHATATGTPVTRAMQVALFPNRILVFPERATEQTLIEIPLTGSMVGAMDQFVSHIWDRIDSWGIAVAGGYWKPVLKMNISPNAEHRFREMQLLLKGSGLIVERDAP